MTVLLKNKCSLGTQKMGFYGILAFKLMLETFIIVSVSEDLPSVATKGNDLT